MHHITLFIACFAAKRAISYCFPLNLDGFVLLAQEINAELGSMSESSDDEFLTSRVVRRRVVIQVPNPTDGVLTEHGECSFNQDGSVLSSLISNNIFDSFTWMWKKKTS